MARTGLPRVVATPGPTPWRSSPDSVCIDHEGQGLGAGLLADAITRMVDHSSEIGRCGLLIHAESEHTRDFYQHLILELLPSPTDELHLVLLTKNARAHPAPSLTSRQTSRAHGQPSMQQTPAPRRRRAAMHTGRTTRYPIWINEGIASSEASTDRGRHRHRRAGRR